MALIDRIASFFKYAPITPDKVTGKVPFVATLGYEKVYGQPQPQDYLSMVNSYKSWAYACAWKNATSVAKCKLMLYKKSMNTEGEEELERVPDPKHPFNQVINAVNPFSNKFELLTITQTYLELTGNAYWWIPKNNLGVPYMIWSIPSHWMRIVPSEKEFIAGYVAKIPQKGKLVPFDQDEIVHFKFPSPTDLFYGTGPLFAAQFGIDLNQEIKTWGINFFLNNAQPSGVLTTEQGLNPDQYARLKDRWNAKYKGSKNAGKIAILEAGLKYQQTGTSVKDAGFDTINSEIRDEIMAMFGVPASKLGLSENVNRANADANDYTYQKETIQPRLTLMEEKLNEKFISIYNGLTGDELCVRFESPIPKDDAARVLEREANIRSGYSSIDDERIADGLEPYNLPETRVPLIPFSLVPAGQPKPEADPSIIPEEDTDQEKSIKTKAKTHKWEIFANATAPQERLFTGVLQRYFQSQHSEVIRNLNNTRSKDLTANIIFNLKEQNEKLKNISNPHIRSAFVTGLELGMKETSSTINFSLFEPNILRAVEARVGFFSEKINQSTADLIESALKDAFKEGESINDVAKRIDKIFNFTEDFRSKAIARTEVIGATNSGQLKAYDEAGIKQKEWLTALDEHVRDSHQINGQIVDLTQSFTTKAGTKLQYPGDRSAGAPAEEVINCRCTVVPVIRT